MSDALEQAVARHYGRPKLKDRLMQAIVAAGLDPHHLTPEDLAPVDEFHTGGRLETVHVLGKLHLEKTDHILDVGCGLGGTARYLATHFGCHVTGIDLTPEYIEIAKTLGERTRTSDRVKFMTASALKMPFGDGSFDAAITFHVAMNIKDRVTLYREVARVLRQGAFFCIYDVMKGANDGIKFPVPWAEIAANSHLTSVSEMRELLSSASFEVTEVEDRSNFAIDFFRQRLKSDGPPPPLGLHILTGENAREKFQNYLQGVESSSIAPTVMIARRQ
jgi:cyclopropane fatty-acyl-phospholipid synthase-like methyltransferase